ncbi:double-strand break repair protein AddB [Methylocapsa palsarum]|uniref:ATP-dependent helicase/nuclease subunit B n=1 Tax=Methylocapsa palsarum TaxID=1612308 RepID=A0A1I3ZVK4_9HYPH|nr:double-strand break repair protein AddB [Methylocapsa palsarum]SFK47666.1 ATP-dependent helicase/nuclease subunit B [Methylocapsa palsarum]
MNKSRIFTIAPGAPFLRTFAEALLDGLVVEGFSRRLSPLDLASATIYVPTRRSARALLAELVRALGRSSILAPRILPLGALEDAETRLYFDDDAIDRAHAPELSPAMGETARRMRLAEMILTWAQVLKHAIVSVGPQGEYQLDEAEAFHVAASAADAWHLAGELAGLIDELIIEDVAWNRLDPLVLPEFDRYWGITLAFLTIAITEWPRILAGFGVVDRARRQVELVEAQSQRLKEERGEGPVIAIGSTGTNRATARLLAAIAASPRGAVVLPGLDLSLDAGAWALISGGGQADDEPSFTHPQAALSRLLKALKVQREDVLSLGAVAPGRAARARFVSEALRPAAATSAWIGYRAGLADGELSRALADVALIEASDEREEALCLAIALREALETPGETAALVTPDRELARRVGAELLRWGIEIEDTAGEPLSACPHGVLARLVAGCAADGLTAQSLSGLLAHPYLRLGLERREIDRLAPQLEIGVLRSPSAAGPLRDRVRGDPGTLIARAKAEAADRFAHPARRRISPPEWEALEDLLVRVGAGLKPLFDLEGPQCLKTWIGAHRAALAAIADQDRADQDRDSASLDALEALFDDLAESATPGMVFDSESYDRFFAAVAGATVVRDKRTVHPRLKIYGLLEARLMEADLILIGGLDETVWPPLARTDAFLNRPMRAALGLTPPERKLGQTAHDFEQAMGRTRVILSRAAKRGGSPTVASRFIQRMAAVADRELDECRARGDAYLRLARTIDRPDKTAPALRRPEPKPQIALRPTRLSVTAIEKLRRDPYAIYAEHVLGLFELRALGAAPEAAELGGAVHAALEQFGRKYPGPHLPSQDEARRQLRVLVRTAVAAAHLDDPSFEALRWPWIEKTIDFCLGFEARRRPSIASLLVECAGEIDIPLADGTRFTLSARADRIEIGQDGRVTLVDYKTGTPPGAQEILVGFAPQLTLEAAMASRGAFSLPADVGALDALYVKLGGPGGGKEHLVAFKGGPDFLEVAEAHFIGLVDLLEQFRDPGTPYPPRPFPKFAAAYNCYDHLARVREWSLSGEPDGAGAQSGA